ncbi:rab family small GTPase [Naegleria gruberi]|uniref:Rab family small GTPase n=1 Tax=Naegleria gruberi TaxID=5762 RepID=D2VIV7_NAEGR|nr:rab family small GTPase [Naegleria gruberi]EFC43092.1 rab family small GTPase [Naegleria gruberi]|eukprot:XP_002675836.1 rab family small GTPase [Naegleria gruberi strain NEG-M]
MSASSSFILMNEEGELLDASLLKIILIGNRQIGKTSLLSYYINNTNIDKIEPTIGFDFTSCLIKVYENRFNLYENKLSIKYSCGLQIWDCSDLDKESNEICTSVFKDTDAIILCYDCNNLQSFIDLKQIHYPLLENYIKLYKNIEYLPKIIVGLKSDLQNNVNDQLVLDFVKQNDMTFIKTSIFKNLNNNLNGNDNNLNNLNNNYMLPFNYVVYANRQDNMLLNNNNNNYNYQLNEGLDLALLNMFLNYDYEEENNLI